MILASQSPRRKELLQLLGVPFDIIPSASEEVIDLSLPIEEAIALVAGKKAEAVYQLHPEAVVIGSDTVVTLDGEILGKPKDEEDARRMLRKLSGRVHQVVTGVAILSQEKSDSFASVCDVVFYDLSEEEIDAYVESKEPMDKAGAYGIQGKGFFLVKEIHGDYYTVVGLPVAEVKRHLEPFLK